MKAIPISGNNLHECTKIDCYFCYLTSPEPKHIKIVLNSVFALIEKRAWANDEIDLLLSGNEVPNRTKKACSCKKYDLKKKI